MGVVSSLCIDTGSRFGSLLWVEYRYTFSNATVYTIGPKKMPSLAEAQTECAALEPQVELDVVEQARQAAAKELANLSSGVDAETVIPAFPEELPESDPSEDVDTRQRSFHRWLLRWVWPQDLLSVESYFLDVWTWLDQKTNPNIQTYLGIDGPTRGTVSTRMGNALTVGELMGQDVPGEIP